MTKDHKPSGRKMPHPHDAKNTDGSIDPVKAKAGALEAIASFESGEYTLKDMNEGQIVNSNVHQINKMCGVNAAIGDEFYIAIRKRNT